MDLVDGHKVMCKHASPHEAPRENAAMFEREHAVAERGQHESKETRRKEREEKSKTK